MTCSLVRLSLIKRGLWIEKWETRVSHICDVEFEPGTSAREIFDAAKEDYPLIPRCEMALVGYPEQGEWV